MFFVIKKIYKKVIKKDNNIQLVKIIFKKVGRNFKTNKGISDRNNLPIFAESLLLSIN